MNRYVFAFHRGGSSILGDIAYTCANICGLQMVSLGDEPECFKELGPDGAARIDPELSTRIGMEYYRPQIENWRKYQGVFAPIRRVDMFPRELLSEAHRSVLLVRDPRDCMVSGYYGFLRLHSGGLQNPENLRNYEAGIDNYVRTSMLPMFKTIVGDYMAHCQADQSLTVLHYEDMVLRFDTWIDSFFGALDLDKAMRDECHAALAGHFSPVGREDTDKHKRQMLPGDHKKKLKPETIAHINSTMGEELRYFGYLV